MLCLKINIIVEDFLQTKRVQNKQTFVYLLEPVESSEKAVNFLFEFVFETSGVLPSISLEKLLLPVDDLIKACYFLKI